MGRVRRGRLPETRAWSQVVALLETNVDKTFSKSVGQP